MKAQWIFFLTAMVVFGFTDSIRAQQNPDLLQAIYDTIETDKRLTMQQKLERKLSLYNTSAEAGGAYLQGFEDLQYLSKLSRETGDFLRPGYPKRLKNFGKKLAQLEKSLKTHLEHPAIKGFKTTTDTVDKVKKAVSLVSEIESIQRDPNIPPSAKRSLTALKATGKALAAFGDKVPLVGAPLAMYGEMVDELTSAMHKVADNIAKSKQGRLSSSEIKEVLGGLPDEGSLFISTDLYKLGIPIVEKITGVKKHNIDSYHIKTKDGWKTISYDQVSLIVAEHRLLNDNENPSVDEIFQYLGDKSKRESLSISAEAKIERVIADEFIEDTHLESRHREPIVQARRKISDAITKMGLPIAVHSNLFRKLVMNEVEDPGSHDRRLVKMAIKRNPVAYQYLKFVENVDDPFALSIERAMVLLDRLRRDPKAALRLARAIKKEQTKVKRNYRDAQPKPRRIKDPKYSPAASKGKCLKRERQCVKTKHYKSCKQWGGSISTPECVGGFETRERCAKHAKICTHFEGAAPGPICLKETSTQYCALWDRKCVEKKQVKSCKRWGGNISTPTCIEGLDVSVVCAKHKNVCVDYQTSTTCEKYAD